MTADGAARDAAASTRRCCTRTLPSPVAPESDEEGATQAAARDKGDKEREGEGRQEGERRRRRTRDRQGRRSRAREDRLRRASTSASSRCPSTARTTTTSRPARRACSSSLVGPVAFADEDYVESTTTTRRRSSVDALRPEEAQDGDVPRQDRAERAAHVHVSADGKKVLYAEGQEVVPRRRRQAAEATATASSSPRRVEVWVDPRAEWQADLPRGLAHRARLPLRPARARPRPRGGREALRAASSTASPGATI